MPKLLLTTSIGLFILLFSGQHLFAKQDLQPTGTIRGGVYLDADGNGQCTDQDTPIPNIDLSFNQDANSITLYSGSNGTYGLPTAPKGIWTVTVHPNPSEWQVTSASSRQVNVSEETGLVQLNVNFCLKQGSGSSNASSRSTSVVQPTATPPVDPVTAIQNDILANATEPLTPQELTSAISEELLKNPPPPDPHQFADIFSEFPVNYEEADWLAYLNNFREMANLPRLTTEQSLSEGGELHSRYMVLLDVPIAHKEDQNQELFTPAGDTAGRNSNIFATSQIEADYEWAINFWISAPFHQVPLLDPKLTTVGFGNYNKEVGTFNMASALDVLSSEGNPNHGVNYPIMYPAQGSETWIVRHSMYEWPDPLTSCPGFTRPTGPPIVLQLGNGSKVPNVESYQISAGAVVLDSCLIHESNYVNPDPFAQETGRVILGERDAIVIMPRQPLERDKEHIVQITADGFTYVWSFKTRQPFGSGE